MGYERLENLLGGYSVSQASIKPERRADRRIRRSLASETRRDAALGIRFRGRTGGVGPYHLYCSRTFEAKFGWAAALPAEAESAASDAAASFSVANFFARDLSSTFVEMTVETVSTPYALIALYTPAAKGKPLRRWLHAG